MLSNCTCAKALFVCIDKITCSRMHHPALRRLADARAFGDAVTAFGKRMAEAQEIGSKDLLRLRALLTAIAIAVFGEATRKPTTVQVLPTSENGSADISCAKRRREPAAP